MIKNIREVVYIPDYLAVICIYNENRNLSVNELHYLYKISYSSLHDMKKLFVEKGWVTIERSEGKHIVKITTSGEELVKKIYDLIDMLGINKEDFFSLKLGKKHKVKENEGKTSKVESEESKKENEDSTETKSTNNGETNVTTNGGTTDEEISFPGEIFSSEERVA